MADNHYSVPNSALGLRARGFSFKVKKCAGVPGDETATVGRAKRHRRALSFQRMRPTAAADLHRACFRATRHCLGVASSARHVANLRLGIRSNSDAMTDYLLIEVDTGAPVSLDDEKAYSPERVPGSGDDVEVNSTS